MPTARSPLARPPAQRHGVAAPKRPVPAPAKAASVPIGIQLHLVLLVALPTCALGLLYFGCCAWLNQESFRRDHLLAQIRIEKERAVQLERALAQIRSTSRIEKEATQLGLTPADPRKTITLGATP
ncbi:hypothetical protein CWRG_00192 [Chthonomonas calidirosea]|uniref:Uncharacterized protein n=1 Tax=Chthonomonas calidirosea (strain DSM 23976 / ICMP 18418 / T49) TaxID=1303518 RepID=S0ETI6_CHTCT|nr:hypothetical protein [Chthonomonas calidirosea]CCW34787.1 hypothetical protein CCALI_00965 [Chthonomonas calidirosea T49]CEK12767.1 hypothetical protein CWRG_00192 [Chthonomonas calidirosea]CEK12768.1 hypothetical protein CP488_00191 [Chthonomonas calidirosea]CEK13797.1 hypothetical protein CTKA_00195 [Chthonomonas calidirosea]